MKKQKQIVQLANGNYVKWWQYSQGHFDVVETVDIFEACDITSKNVGTFFMENVARVLKVEYTATIL